MTIGGALGPWGFILSPGNMDVELDNYTHIRMKSYMYVVLLSYMIFTAQKSTNKRLFSLFSPASALT